MGTNTRLCLSWFLRTIPTKKIRPIQEPAGWTTLREELKGGSFETLTHRGGAACGLAVRRAAGARYRAGFGARRGGQSNQKRPGRFARREADAGTEAPEDRPDRRSAHGF